MAQAFDEIARALREFEGFPHPWFVSGGWAIDLWLGRQTREHEDLEIGIFRADQGSLRAHFPDRELYKAFPGRWVPWGEGEWLSLPIHQVLVRPRGRAPMDERWEPGPGEIQFFLNDVADDVWLCRRDERVTRPVDEIVTSTAAGIPIVVPEIQLLYKAKHHADKDERDFDETVGALTPTQRAWLRHALAIVHPNDPWLGALS